MKRAITSICILLAGFGMASTLKLTAQDPSRTDPEFTVTVVEGPKRGAFAVGDGAVWFLGQGQLSKLDPADNHVISVPLEDAPGPGPMLMAMKGTVPQFFAVGGGSIWRLARKSKHELELQRLDETNGRLLDEIPLNEKQSGSLSYAYGSIWIWSDMFLDHPLVRVDPSAKQVTTIDLGKGEWSAPCFSEGSVWILGMESGVVKRIDIQSNKIAEEFSIGQKQKNGIFSMPFKGGSYYFAVGDGMLWVADSKNLSSGKYVLSRFDLKTHERVAKLESDPSDGPPVIWHGYVWLSTAGNVMSGHYLTKISPQTNHIVGTIFLLPTISGRILVSGSMPPRLLADQDSLWTFSVGTAGNPPITIHRIQATSSDASPQK